MDILRHHDLTMIPNQHLPLVYRAAERVYEETDGRITPTANQLQCLVALENEDVLYIAATGSGKTLIIAMYLLVHPEAVAVTICPLKELQRGQV